MRSAAGFRGSQSSSQPCAVWKVRIQAVREALSLQDALVCVFVAWGPALSRLILRPLQEGGASFCEPITGLPHLLDPQVGHLTRKCSAWISLEPKSGDPH